MGANTKREYNTDLLGGLIALVLIIAAWFTGIQIAEKDMMPYIRTVAGDYEIISEFNPNNWLTISEKDTVLISTGTGEGYGGDLRSVIRYNTVGEILSVNIIQHRETVSFLKKVIRKNFIKQFTGLRCDNPFADNIDMISGATLSSIGINTSVEEASHSIADSYFKFDIPPKPEKKLIAGLKEISWLAIIALAYLSASIRTKRQKLLRWTVMIISLAIIGFKLNAPLSISLINKTLLGFWPDWHSQLYFYIIIIGILLLILISGKNHYCNRICPFGTSQEIIGNISSARQINPGKFRIPLLWTQRILALAVIISALIFRKPGAGNYEVFGTMFRLTGNNLQFILLIIVAVSSLFIKRPWCGYLCPVKPVNDYFRFLRSSGIKILNRNK